MAPDPERFFLHPRASRDIRSAVNWYRQRDRDIAADFVQAVDRAITAILASPGRWPLKNRWRRYLLWRFPFSIAYREVVADRVEIGAVIHHKRRPDYWIR